MTEAREPRDESGSGGGRRRVSDAERQRVIDALCEHFADDRLGLEEFERRLDRAHEAGGPNELEGLLDDLPASRGTGDRGASPDERAGRGDRERARRGDPRTASPVDRGGSAPAGSGDPAPADRRRASPAERAGEEPRRTPRTSRVPAARVPESQFEFAIWSGRRRSGRWVPARTIRVVACMGGVELDFREALFGPGEFEVDVIALMGGVEIVVPPGIHVETGGFAFLGALEDDLTAGQEPAPPDAPTLRITGFALMGGVEVVCRPRGDSPGTSVRKRRC